MVMDECRSSWETILRSAPAARVRVAAPCRRSCSRIGGRSAAAASRVNWSVTAAGCGGGPLGVLPFAVVGEDGGGGSVEGDGVGRGVGLRVVQAGLPAVLQQLPAH